MVAGGTTYIHREDVHDNSMSSLHTPVSLIEYGLRREAFGEGMLAITDEGCLTAGAAQKYPARQREFLDRLARQNKTVYLYTSIYRSARRIFPVVVLARRHS